MSYKQCTLKRTKEIGMSLSTTVTYIPVALAKVGKFIELKDNGSWHTWQVAEVSSTELSDIQGKKLHKRWHTGWNNNI